jgi:DNA helicase-2/ATP-dependent DNA helicase PcrA
MNTLTLSYASKRFIHGQSFYSLPSRFLDEIPINYLNYIKNSSSDINTRSPKNDQSHYQKMTSSTSSIYSIGQLVKHAKFGLGTVVNYEGSGDSMRLQTKFQKVGTKWLISSYANLELV